MLCSERREVQLSYFVLLLVPDPADWNPEGLPLQALEDDAQLCTDTRSVLLNQDPIHQVAVLLLNLLCRLTHLLQILLLRRRDYGHYIVRCIQWRRLKKKMSQGTGGNVLGKKTQNFRD